MSSNSLLTPSILTKESLVILENNLVAANRVNRKFENQFVKIGSALTIRKPNRFTISSGAGLAVQDIAEPSVSITVNQQKHADFQFTSQDLTLTVEEFSERYLKPAMATLANQIDSDVLANFSTFSNVVGTPNTTPSTFSSSVQLTGRRMDDLATPQDNRTLVLNPNAYWSLASNLQSNLFVMPTAKDALVKGYLAVIDNYEVYMDQNTPTFSTGVHTATSGSTITGFQSGGTLSTCGWSVNDTFLPGEVITIAGVNAINPQNRQSTGVLKPFVLTGAVVTANTNDARTTATLTVSPAPVTSGPYQNIASSWAVSAAVAFLTGTGTASSTFPQNMAFTRDAMGLVMVPLEIPQGVDFAARETYRNISMRVIRAYDINNDVFPTRIDVLYGTAQYYDELGVRLTG